VAAALPVARHRHPQAAACGLWALPNMKGHGLYFPYPPIKSNQYSGSQWDYLHKRIKTANVFGQVDAGRKIGKVKCQS